MKKNIELFGRFVELENVLDLRDYLVFERDTVALSRELYESHKLDGMGAFRQQEIQRYYTAEELDDIFETWDRIFADNPRVAGKSIDEMELMIIDSISSLGL